MYGKWARQIFFELKTLINELIFVKNIFHPESIKNDNAAVSMRHKFLQRERSQQLHRFRKR